MVTKQVDYSSDLTLWRTGIESDLKNPEGWLTVAGLFWLHEGDNSFGTKESSIVKLPASSGAPPVAGTLVLREGKVTLQAKETNGVKVNGKIETFCVLKSDADGSPDTVQVGSVSFKIIVRGHRIGARLFDAKSKAVTEFTGRKWFPIAPKLRVKAKYFAYPQAKSITITNILGDSEPVKVPGCVVFTLNGTNCRLEAQEEGDTLFFNFKDLTNGKETYPAGRFLNTPKAVDGFVVLDFNRAVNPPCAFTAFATCPLPPQSNYLTIAIRAGELSHHPADK